MRTVFIDQDCFDEPVVRALAHTLRSCLTPGIQFIAIQRETFGQRAEMLIEDRKVC